MRTLARIITFLGISLISLFVTRPALAFPPLPSSFYGTVKVNGANVPDGTLVKASINGQVYAESQTQTYQGDSVYSLDVPGDDSSTTAVEGGHDGETILFTIGGKAAGQTGTWKGGTNINLNLNVPMIAAQDTPTPTITRTATNTVQSTATPTTEVRSTPTAGVRLHVSQTPTATMKSTSTIPPTSTQSTPATPTASTQSTLAATVLMQSTPTIPAASMQSTLAMPTALMHSHPTIPAATNPDNDSVNSDRNIIVIGIVAAGCIFAITLWLIFNQKPKM